MRKRFEVVWSAESVRRTDEITAYLEKNWSKKEAHNFLIAIESFEEIVSYFPEIYPQSCSVRGLRRAVVV